MRLKIKFAPSTQPIQRNTQHIVSWLHKTLGTNNKYHKVINKIYSISGIVGGIKNEDHTISYLKGATIFISTEDMEVVRLINKNLKVALLADELEAFSVTSTMDEAFLNDELNYFMTDLNGIFLYKRTEKGYSRNSVIYTQNEWVEEINIQVKNRLLSLKPNLDLENFYIDISDNERNRLVKSNYKDILLLSSNVTLRIYGSIEAKKLILNYGIGHLTGSGYGCVYPTQLVDEYR